MPTYEIVFGTEKQWRDQSWKELAGEFAHGLGMLVFGGGALVGFGFLTVVFPPLGIAAYVILGLPCLSLFVHGLYKTIARPVHMVQKAWEARETRKWAERQAEREAIYSKPVQQSQKQLNKSGSYRVMNNHLSQEASNANDQNQDIIQASEKSTNLIKPNNEKKGVFTRLAHSVMSLFGCKSSSTQQVNRELGIGYKR